MTEAQPTINDEIERNLRTGESDPYHAAWPGGFMERANRAHDDLPGALVRAARGPAAGCGTEPPAAARRRHGLGHTRESRANGARVVPTFRARSGAGGDRAIRRLPHQRKRRAAVVQAIL